MKKPIYFLLCVFLFLGINFSCSFSDKDDSSKDYNNQETMLSIPSISPSGGDYSEGKKTISLTSKTENSVIFYTTDGTEPSSSSSMYTESFSIIGSKTIKAVTYSKDLKTKSAVATAVFNLNVGKTQSQLGVVTGKIGLSSSLSPDVQNALKDSTIYIYSDDLPGVVKQGKVGEEFYFDGLDTSKSYSFYFTNNKPSVFQESKNSRAIDYTATLFDKNGNPIVAVEISNVKPEEGAGVDLSEVKLDATGSIKGKAFRYNVTGEQESDNSGISVFIPGTSYVALTDENGNFEILGVPQGLHTIRATLSGYNFAQKENVLLKASEEDKKNPPVAEITDALSLYFGQGIVKGTVLLNDEIDDFSGTQIVLTDSTNSNNYSAITDKNGSWGVTDVYPGKYTIEFIKDGYESQTVCDVQIIGAKVTNVPLLRLYVIGGSLNGKVLIDEKSDLTGISVLAENTNGKMLFALTNEEGNFAFENVMPGTWTISATYVGYSKIKTSEIIVLMGETLDLGLIGTMEKTTYSVTGSVVLEGQDSGFEGTSVLITNANDANDTQTAVTNVEGVYNFSSLNPGTYVLTISRNGFLTNSGVTVEVGSSLIAVAESVVLKSNAGIVSGDVTLEGKDSFEGISILLSNQNTDKTYSTVTDSNGHYALSGIKPGTYRIQATFSGYNTSLSDPFTVSSGEVSTPSDQMLKVSMRSLFGTVILENKTDFTGVRITATKITETTEIYSALSNSSGTYAIAGMTPGEYILSYSFEGYVSKTSSSVSLTDNSSIEIEKIELKKATGKIAGIVNLEGCTNHSGIKVELVGTDYTTTTDSDGKYEFSVPSGNYPGGVRFTKEDYKVTAQAQTLTVLTDSTYGVPTVEMKGIAATVKGKLTISGWEEGKSYKDVVSITIDGDGFEKFSTTTDDDGSWQIDHIPLGYVTFRYKSNNIPDVTQEIKVVPCDFVDCGSLELIPDSATLKGFALLNGMSDNANIIVTVQTEGKDDIVSRTDSTGFFTVNNVLASVSHTVTFSKAGWDSLNLTVENLTKLEERVIAESGSVILQDTTSPVIENVVLNEGANFIDNPQFSVLITATEEGSGISQMAVQLYRITDDGKEILYPTEKSFEPFKANFTYDISSLPSSIYGGNDEYKIIITLKDLSGNESQEKSDSITLSDQVKTLKGVLTGEDLHLTKVNSPYRVENNILVEEGNVLTIDPGVEIRFAGNYYLRINGEINARGTEEEHIVFTKTDDAELIKGDDGYWDGNNWVYNTTHYYWNGLQVTAKSSSLNVDSNQNYISGNIFEYCDVKGAIYPFNKEEGGSAFVSNMNIDGGRYFYSGDKSVIKSSIIKMHVCIENYASLDSSTVEGLSVGSYSTVKNNIVSGIVNLNSTGAMISGNTFQENTSFNISSSTQILTNEIIALKTPIKVGSFSGKFSFNKFTDCGGTILDASSSSYSSQQVADFTGNYWGTAYTEELNLIGANDNASFISDYYDGNFDLSKIDYSGWVTGVDTTATVTSLSIPKAGISKATSKIKALIKGSDFDALNVKKLEFTCSNSLIVENTKESIKVLSPKVVQVEFTIPSVAGEYEITVSNGSTSAKQNFIVKDYSDFKVGDILYNDGTRISKDETYSGSASPIAVVVGFNAYGAALGVGVKQSDSYLRWAPNDTTGYNTIFYNIICTPNKSGTGAADTAVFSGDSDGSDNWQMICIADEQGAADAATNYPAFNYANTYSQQDTNCTGEYAEGWYLPSIAELTQIYRNKDVVNSALSNCNGMQISSYYWSSSPLNNFNYAWVLYFGDVYLNDYGIIYKYEDNYVCCVRAF